MTDEEIIRNFTELQFKVDGNSREIKDIKDRQDDYGQLIATMQVFSNEQDHMKTDISEIKNDVKIIAEKPGKRWDSLIGTIIGAIAGAFIGWAISGFPGA